MSEFPAGYQIPTGYTPGKEFVSTGDPYGIKIGLITRVDELNMKADVKVLTGGGYQYELDLVQGMYGPRSFWGGVPEVNSIVILGYRRKHKNVWEAVILGYVPVGNRGGLRFDPFSPVDPSTITAQDGEDFGDLVSPSIRYKRLRLKPGDVGGMSSEGSELALSKDIRMCNAAGDLFELRTSDRTIVSQSVHRVEAESGVHKLSGPIRRGSYWLPPDIYTTNSAGQKTLLAPNDYFGREDLQAAGPGPVGSPMKFSNTSGVLLDVFNDANEFPPVTYSNGRRVFYPATTPAVNFEDPLNGAGAEAYTEQRLEMHHTTDLTPDVLEEIDGFTVSPRIKYIEHVLGTVVGNDPHSGMGQRQYARILKPKIFESFDQLTRGKFTLEEVDRNPLNQDMEAETTAGAFLFRITPPKGVEGDAPFGVSVSKQGKLFMSLPGSKVENYSDGATKNVSAEINMDGALKMHLGASSPDKVSLNLTLDGGIVADIGSSSDGQAIKVRYHSSYSAEYTGVPDVNDVAYSMSVTGNSEVFCSADSIENVQGSKSVTTNGGYNMMADRLQIQAQSGYTLNAGESNVLVSGKSQYNYAQQVLENVVTGGKVSTILAGGLVQNIAAGPYSTTVGAGATSLTCAGGAYTVNVAAGGISIAAAAGAVSVAATSGALSLSAPAGAVALTAGLALNLTAGVSIGFVAPQVLVGGAAAVLGVARGAPMLPPGAPSLDWVTGMPLQGSAVFRSI
jgi:hypothetical protein